MTSNLRYFSPFIGSVPGSPQCLCNRPSTLARLHSGSPRWISLESSETWSSRRGSSCITATTRPRHRKPHLPGIITNCYGHRFTHLRHSLSLPVQLQNTQLNFNSQHRTAAMSPSRDTQNATSKQFGDLNLSITGLGTEYPPHQLDPACLNTLVSRHYPNSPAFVPQSPPLPEQL